MKKIFQILILLLLAIPNISFARQNITDWYIKDFQSEIIVNKDSTLDITETITADCGNLPGKHGIFRILPTRIDQQTKTPIELESITDGNGNSHEYEEKENDANATITWKIGDPNRTVSGENVYVIKYKVKNVVRFGNENFDELYWNLNGNFWQIETDNFHAKIIFPSEINSENSQINQYSGSLGNKDAGLAIYAWTRNNVLEFSSTKTLRIGEGITTSITFPKNIIIPYKPGFWEKFGNYFFFIIPIITFIVCFIVWKKYGDDPEVDKTVIAEYEPPENLSPLEIGMLSTSGRMKNEFITAEIIHLASLGFIKITEIENKILFVKTKEYELERLRLDQEEKELNEVQQFIMKALFTSTNISISDIVKFARNGFSLVLENEKNKNNQELAQDNSAANKKIKLSELKNKFHVYLREIELKTKTSLEERGFFESKGGKYSKIMLSIAIFVIISGIFILIASGHVSIFIWTLILSGIVIFIFSLIMPKRTMKGAETNWQIRGFKLFMKTAEQHRAQFYEKENMFEKILPYAIAFGLTKEWIKKMKEVYGEEFYASHMPAWYVGSSIGAFDADSFASIISDISSDISASTSAPSGSGSGGGGSSGGGGGGGGGGGW